MPECERKFNREWFWAHLNALSQERYNPDTGRFESPNSAPLADITSEADAVPAVSGLSVAGNSPEPAAQKTNQQHRQKTKERGEIPMQKYPITTGVIPAPVKIVLYGPEGIGKTTLAAAFPNALFLDTEGGTKRLNVARLPRPESWAMLLDEVAAAAQTPCGTLVLDTADWAEQLCAAAVCARGRVSGIEGFGYGKGYVYLKEEFAKLLAALDGAAAAGKHIVVTAHAQITKFEQPDEMGSYDRWTMKTSKQVAPLLREWCDALLFANYKTFVVKDGDGKAAKGKAQGGRRVLYTTHHPCWDAKNRFGLPDELPMDFSAIAGIVRAEAAPEPERSAAAAASTGAPTTETCAAHSGARSVDGLPGVADTQTHTAAAAAFTPEPASGKAPAPPAHTQPVPAPAPAAAPAPSATPPSAVPSVPVRSAAAPGQTPAASPAHAELIARMREADIDEAELRCVVHNEGYYPEDMPVSDYSAEFVAGRLLARWEGVVQAVTDSRDIPF